MCLHSYQQDQASDGSPQGDSKSDGNPFTSSHHSIPQVKDSSSSLIRILLWCLFTYLSKEFCLFLPVYQSEAGAKTFIPAFYEYDDENTHFDNSILTYGTDYILGFMMLYASYRCYTATSSSNLDVSQQLKDCAPDPSLSKPLRIKSTCLFLSYAISVFAGGYAHQNFTGGIDDLNTTQFRILWTICVGSVAGAGGFMGACAAEIYKRLNRDGNPARVRFSFFYTPDIMWIIYGGYMTLICAQGSISYKRPACDIFVAGTSQFVPTVLAVVTAVSLKWDGGKSSSEGFLQSSSDGVLDRMRPNTLYILCFGFFFNAPLLYTYPLYVQYTSLSLGVVNTILHINLAIAWSMEALSLYRFCEAFNYAGYDTQQKKIA